MNILKVLLFSKYSRNGASSRLRSMQYIAPLNNDGISIEVSPLFSDEYLQNLYKNKKRPYLLVFGAYIKRMLKILTINKYDCIWIEYELLPFLPAIFERLMGLVSLSYVVDYDDAVFHNYDRSSKFFMRKILGRKIDRVMANAGCVVVGNDYLKARAEQAGARSIELVPTVVDANRYTCKTKNVKGGELIVGWIGSPSTQKYVVELQNVLKEICKAGSARLVLVGATSDIVSELKGINVCIEPWAEESEAALVGSFDIGIMPLEDGPWEKGKCGYKLIQYMASGKPVVASPVGVNQKIVLESESGLLASSHEEWQQALVQLIESPELRKQFGVNGRQAVEQHYSLQAQAPRLVRIFKGFE